MTVDAEDGGDADMSWLIYGLTISRGGQEITIVRPMSIARWLWMEVYSTQVSTISFGPFKSAHVKSIVRGLMAQQRIWYCLRWALFR